MASVIDINCHKCDGIFKRTLKQTNQVVKRSGVWSCRNCASVVTAAKNSKPIGTTRVHAQTGYIEEKTKGGWKRQHILVVEKSINRDLTSSEVVHHINEVKDDNRLSNLRLMTNGEHTALHHINAKRSANQCQNIARARRTSKTTKLTDVMVQKLRVDIVVHGAKQYVIAKELGVSPMTVSRAVNNLTWKNYV